MKIKNKLLIATLCLMTGLTVTSCGGKKDSVTPSTSDNPTIDNPSTDNPTIIPTPTPNPSESTDSPTPTPTPTPDPTPTPEPTPDPTPEPEVPDDEASVVAFDIDYSNAKTDYYYDEELDYTGVTFTKTLSNGHVIDMTIDEVGIDSSNVRKNRKGTYEIIFVYDDFTTSMFVNYTYRLIEDNSHKIDHDKLSEYNLSDFVNITFGKCTSYSNGDLITIPYEITLTDNITYNENREGYVTSTININFNDLDCDIEYNKFFSKDGITSLSNELYIRKNSGILNDDNILTMTFLIPFVDGEECEYIEEFKKTFTFDEIGIKETTYDFDIETPKLESFYRLRSSDYVELNLNYTTDYTISNTKIKNYDNCRFDNNRLSVPSIIVTPGEKTFEMTFTLLNGMETIIVEKELKLTFPNDIKHIVSSISFVMKDETYIEMTEDGYAILKADTLVDSYDEMVKDGSYVTASLGIRPLTTLVYTSYTVGTSDDTLRNYDYENKQFTTESSEYIAVKLGNLLEAHTHYDENNFIYSSIDDLITLTDYTQYFNSDKINGAEVYEYKASSSASGKTFKKDGMNKYVRDIYEFVKLESDGYIYFNVMTDGCDELPFGEGTNIMLYFDTYKNNEKVNSWMNGGSAIIQACESSYGNYRIKWDDDIDTIVIKGISFIKDDQQTSVETGSLACEGNKQEIRLFS